MDRLRGQASSANHRQTGWGLRRIIRWCLCGNAAAAAPYHDGLAWILAVSWAELKLQDGSQWFAWRRSYCTVARACLRGCMCMFAVSVVCPKQVSWALVHADVWITNFFLTSPYKSATHSLQGHGVHMRSCMRSLCIRVGGAGWGSSTKLCRALIAWRGGLFFIERGIEVLSCFFSIFDAGRSIRVCMCQGV